MPARLDLSGDAFRDHVQEQARIRKRNQRAREKASRDRSRDCPVTAMTQEGPRHVTPPTPARHAVPPRERPSTPPKGGSPPVPSPNRSAAVIDALRAAGLCDHLSPRDHAAIKASTLSPAAIVEALAAAVRGEWGNAWLRDNLSVHAVIDRYSAFDAARRHPVRERPRSAVGRALELYGYGLE